MSSSGIQSISSGPLIIRTYNDSSSSDVTYVLKDYDYPVSSNYVLITSTNGQLVPSDNIYVSSIITSSFKSCYIEASSVKTDYLRASTSYLSTVFGFSPVQFYSPIRINNNNPPVSDTQLFVNGTTIFSEPGAQSTSQIAGVNIWGLPNGNPITSSIDTSRTIDITEPISKINFQLIGSGGTSVNSNNNITDEDLPGIGAYIAGTLAVKQGDKLQFTIGTVGDSNSGSKGTSLIYLSSIGNGIFISSLVCVAGAGGGNGWSPDHISSSSGGGHGGGTSGRVTTDGNTDYYAFGTIGYDGLSTINGNYQSFADAGQGGKNNPGPPPSGGLGGGQPGGTYAGSNGETSSINNLLTNYGLVNGGAGGIGNKIGGYGGGGYLGGGGGQGGENTSAGGGGGATYIAVSTLSNYLSNLLCLGGQWISQNNASPFGGSYGLPTHPGFAYINGYEPNDTLYTNGDVQCRVLRYEMLDPPINAITGAAALWATYPAIDIVTMNDNPIVECGGIEIDSGGITSVGPTVLTGSEFYFSSINPTNHSTFKLELDGANLLAYKSTIVNPNNDATFIQNTGGGQLVLATENPIIFINNIDMGNNFVGINQKNPQQQLDIVGNLTISNTAYLPNISSNYTSTSYISSANLNTSSITTSAPSLNITANNTSTIGNLNVSQSLNVADNLNVTNVTTLTGMNVSSINGTNNLLYITANNTSTIGNLNVSQSLNVANNLNVTDITNTNFLNVNTISSGTTNTNFLNVNTISSGTTNTNFLNVNTISSGTTNTNIINVNTISSGNVVNSLTSLSNSISLSGSTGDITISAAPQVDIQAFNSTNIPSNYGKFAVITDNTVSTITLNSALNPPNGAFINLINQSNIQYNVITSGINHILYTNTLITPIYYQPLLSWIAPSYYTVSPVYIYINDTLTESIAKNIGYTPGTTGATYSILDYVVVGGGGGGGGAEDRTTAGATRYGGGGGGSGYLSSSVTFVGSNDVFVYNAPKTPGTNSISLAGFSTINVIVGDGGGRGGNGGGGGGTGGTTILKVTYFNSPTVYVSSIGGGGGGGGIYASCGGAGGNGFNGGGGGFGGHGTLSGSPCGGSGGIATGGGNGKSGNDPTDYSGAGGYYPNSVNQAGAGSEYACSAGASNAGGGGGMGSGVIVPSVPRTGASGSAYYDNHDDNYPSYAYAYTGAGGGGGANIDVGGGYHDATGGAKGYAILWLHN